MRFTKKYKRAKSEHGSTDPFLLRLRENVRRALVTGAGAMAAGAVLVSTSGAVYALPQGGEVAAGSAQIAASQAEMSIHQTSQNAVINWNSFSIAAGERVDILQPNAQAALLNRVLGSSPSEIFGVLQANGRVFLVNPAGVFFAPGAQVDAGALVASTMNITNADFMAGRYAFISTPQDGSVINRGELRAKEAGAIALLGKDVVNEGVIVAKKGTVTLAAGGEVSLDFSGDGRVEVVPSKAAVEQAVTNRGLVEADGGLVFMSAATGDALTSSAVNQEGIVRAGSLGGAKGVIRMTANDVRLAAGSVTDASGASGGTVEIGGGWQGSGDLSHAQNVTIDRGAAVRADAVQTGGAGGTVAVWSDGMTKFSGEITARGNGTGTGGAVETSGAKVQITGRVDASSSAGKSGEWLIDPGDVIIKNLTGTETASDTLIDVQSVKNTLNGGTSTTVQTTAGNNDYSLTVQDAIQKTAGGDATLTLKATGSIAVNADITSTAGKLNVDIISDANHLSGGNISVANGVQLKTLGGDLKMRGELTKNGVGFANSPNAGTSGIDLGSAMIDTRVSNTPGSVGGNVYMAGSTTTADAGVKLAGTQIDTGTGKVTLIGNSSGGGKGISVDSASRINTRSVELRTDSIDLAGTIAGGGDAAGSAKVWTLSDDTTVNFGTGSGGLDLAGDTFTSTGKIRNFYKNTVGDAAQKANVIANGVTADQDLAIHTGAGKLTVSGAVNVAAGHALTLGSKNMMEGAGVLTSDALVLDAADATVNLSGTHALGKLDGAAKGLTLKNGTNLKIGEDTGLVTTSDGTDLDVAGNLTVGARGITNGAGAMKLKASGTLTLDANAEVKSTGASATTLEAAAVTFDTDSKVSTAGGTISVKTDALTIPTGAQGTLSSANGKVTVETRSAGKTIAVGSSSAADLTLTNLDFISSGTGEIHLGNVNTGAVEIGDADVKSPLTVESGAAVKFTGTLTNTNGKNTTFKASAVDFGTGANLAAGAGTMTMVTDAITNWNNVTFADTNGAGTFAVKPKTAGNFTVGGTSGLVTDAGFAKLKAGNFHNVVIGTKDNAGTATIAGIASGNLPTYTSILTNGALSITGAIQGAAGDTLALYGDGLTQSAPIEVGNLLLLGKGSMDLSTQANEIKNIAADMTEGSLKLKNHTHMKVAVVEDRTVNPAKNVDGLKTKSTDIKMAAGQKLTVEGALKSTDDTKIEADALDLGNNKVNVGKKLTLEKADKTQTINVGTGANDWNINNANYGEIKIGDSAQTGDIIIKGATFKNPSDIETQGNVKLTGASKAGADGKSDMKIKANTAELPTASDTLAVKNLTLDLSGGLDLGLGKILGQKDGKVNVSGVPSGKDIYIKDDALGVPTNGYRISYRTINDALDGFGGFDVAGDQHLYFYGGTVNKSINAAGKLGVEVRDNVTITGEGTKLTVGSDPSAGTPDTEITGGFTVKQGKSVTVKGKGAGISVNTAQAIDLENNAAFKVEGDEANVRLQSRGDKVIFGSDAALTISGGKSDVKVTGTALDLGARAKIDLGNDSAGYLALDVDTLNETAGEDNTTNITGKGRLDLAPRTTGRAMTVDNNTAGAGLHITGDQLNGKLFGSDFGALSLGNEATGDVTIDGITANNSVTIRSKDTNKITIGTGGLTVGTDRRVTLKTGSVENSGGAGVMNIGAGSALNLYTNSITNLVANGSSPSVTGTGTLGIGTYNGTKSIGLGDGAAGDLQLTNNKFTSVFGSGFSHYAIGNGDQSIINVAGSSLGKDVTLQANNINFAGDMTLAPGKTLVVNAKTAANQTTGKIKASNLAALGGNIALEKDNEIDTLAADALSVRVKSDALTIGQITTPEGAPVASRTIKGVKSGEAGGTAGDIVLSADSMTFSEAVAGKGNLTLQQANAATNLNVGTTGTGLNLPANLFGGNKIKDGFKHVYLGSEDATGATKVGGNLNFVDPTTIRSGKTAGSMTVDGSAKIATNGNDFALESKDLTTATGSEVDTGTGNLTLKTDKIDLNGKMKGKKALNILPISNNRDIRLGANDSNSLSLLDRYFNGNNRTFWEYEIINIGDRGGGGRLYQSGYIDMPFTVNIQQAVTNTSGGVDISGTINTNGRDYSVASNTVNLNNATISADGVNGNHGNVAIQADTLNHTGSKITGHGDVSFDTYTPGKTINFGTPGSGGSASDLTLASDIFSGTGLLQKNPDGRGFRKIRIGGDNAGNVSVGNVDLPEGLADAVSIKTGGSVTSTGVLKSVPTLEIEANTVNLTGPNEIRNLGNITSAAGVSVETKGGTTVTGKITGTNAPINITNKDGGNVTIAPGGQIVGTGTSDVVIEAQGGAFKNKGGANAIKTDPGQRYIVHTEDSIDNELNGLVFEFRRYGTDYTQRGSITIPAGKNALFYKYQPELKLYSTRAYGDENSAFFNDGSGFHIVDDGNAKRRQLDAAEIQVIYDKRAESDSHSFGAGVSKTTNVNADITSATGEITQANTDTAIRSGAPTYGTNASNTNEKITFAEKYNSLNYKVTVDYRIVPRKVTVTGKTETVDYSGNPHNYTGLNGVTFTNFANGQTATTAGISGSVSYTPIADATKTSGFAQNAIHAGQYDVGIAGSNLTANNYVFDYKPGKLTIKPRDIHFTAPSGTRIYGAANNSVAIPSPTYTGTLGAGDSFANYTVSAVDGGGHAVTERTGVGSYTMRVEGAALAPGSRGYASDYNITSADGTLTITPRDLYITAGDKQRAYGADNGTASYVNGTRLVNVRPTDAVSGLVNGDAVSSITETIDPTATTTTNASTGGLWTHASAAQFGSGTDTNYTIHYIDGHFTIVPRDVLITAGSASRDYGAPNPVVTAYTVERGDHTSWRGLLAGDDISGVQLYYAPNINASTPGGVYGSAIHVDPTSVVYTGGTNLSNYRFRYAPGTLTIRGSALRQPLPQGGTTALTASTVASQIMSSMTGGQAGGTGGSSAGVSNVGSGSNTGIAAGTSSSAQPYNAVFADGVTVNIPQDPAQTSWQNRVVITGGNSAEAHDYVEGADNSFGFDLGRTRGHYGIHDEIPGGTSEAIPVLFTDGGSRDLDGIYSINYGPGKLAIKPASKKVEIPDPKEIRNSAEQTLNFLYRTQSGDYKITFGNGIVTIYPQNDAALAIVTDKNKSAKRAVLASGLLTAIEELGVTPVEIRAVYIFKTLDEDEE
ncbi:hypothetical protein TAMA11512_18990 [Selenomonas sp. TAMA-11512]|uniref:two-partner secretion domain-containing protein n=1 Tax=Selenomonas sp. TAMA-11512 TaxID=3095337 RepID=UPI003086FF61|nr:hypothetical protein TAMA11512_18990 [Selenomonas sp. TAMA-11512]